MFDERYPPGEQIPRRLEAVFISASGQYGDVVSMVINGFRIGDPLTDRGWNETGYRWHDALHLAHAVCLGWSPVLRNVAGLRRRSDPRTDHVEDGGRAVVADEAIAWATFCYARTRGWLRGGPVGAVLLDRVQEMTYALEVSSCTRPEWERAITIGMGCMLSLWQHGGGLLIGDLRERTLEFCPPVNGVPDEQSARPGGPTSAGTGSRSTL